MNKNIIWEFASADWTGNICLCNKDGSILPYNLGKSFYPEYFPNNCKWPIDPKTGEKLTIWRNKD